MLRMVVASVLLAALVLVQVGCAVSPEKAEAGTIARIDPSKEGELKSPQDDVAVSITVRNNRQSVIEFHWLDYEGKRVRYARIKAGAEIVQRTFEGHYWIILGEDGKPLGIYRTPARDAVIVVD